MWPLNRKILILIWGLLGSPLALADSVTAGFGTSQATLVSGEYKPKNIATTTIYGALSHHLTGLWSVMGKYETDIKKSSLQGFTVGIVYDSDPIRSKSGDVAPDGTPEVQRVPKWLIRTTAGIGQWRVSDTLEINKPNLGNKNKAPVQADMYGFTFGVGLYRFMAENFALFGAMNVAVASAGDFGMNNTGFSVGVLWQYD